MREPRVRKFNPGAFQSDQEVIDQFVVRKPELDIVLDVLRGNIESSSCQHVLVVAPRGRGKSMLLARVAAELRQSSDFQGQLFALRFMEESQEIFNIADFWLESLFFLASQLTKIHPDLSRELNATHADLSEQWQDNQLAVRARAAVLNAADRMGKKLVFMLENLQTLCEDTDEHFGWQLRKALQSEPQIMLLATATSRFEGLDNVEQPFYELFRQIDLQPLDTEDCRCLWRVISGDPVGSREIRPLQILTGGSPRLIVIVADFARHRSLRELMEKLVTLIDDHTEYFRGHLESFAKTERRVYLAVIDLWQPSLTGEIAARARMDVRGVSALLGRLVNRGAVIVEGGGKKKLYSAAERLYSIYYKLRRERDEAAVVRNLVHFMTVFYSGPEFGEFSSRLAAEAADSVGIRVGLERAATERPEMLSAFPESFSGRQRTATGRERAVAGIAEAQPAQTVEQGKGPDRDSLIEIARELFNRDVAQGERGDPEAEMAAYDELFKRFGDTDDPAILALVAEAMLIMAEAYQESGRPAQALAMAERVEGPLRSLPDRRAAGFRRRSRWLRANALFVLGKPQEALPEVEHLLASFSPQDDTMLRALQVNLPALVAAGAPAQAILEIVLRDKDKASVLAPLVVALRQEAGETVRAPSEVMETAVDIRAQFKR